MNSGEARLEILSRIYQAQVRAQEVLERDPVHPSGRDRRAAVEQFAEYAAEYRARVTHCTAEEVPRIVAGLLKGERVILPPNVPEAWAGTLDAVPDTGQDHRALTTFGAVLTGCALAVAETGTVVLDHGAGQGRRALTLIPDHHVCVVRADQVVDSVPEAVLHLGAAVSAGQPLTWISGPSATSDIELSRVEGVHGPRRLDIVLVG